MKRRGTVASRLQAKVREFIEQHRLLSRGDRVLIGVSGGPDSVALLHLLLDARAELGLHLEVAHVDHGIRGVESRGDADFVRELAATAQLPFHGEAIVPAALARGTGNLEAQAREARYRFFASVAERRRLSKVAVGHTRDDQAETVLLRLFRGSGTTGLGGMAPARRFDESPGLTLVRPLLGIGKDEALDYLRERNLPYRLDATNRDTRLLRNWIRLRLMPRLQRRIDTRIAARLARQASLFREEKLWLDELAAAELEGVRAGGGIDRRRLFARGKIAQRLILRRWLEEARGHLRGIGFNHIEDLINWIALDKPQSRIAIPGGWELVREYEAIRLEEGSRNRRPICYSYVLELGAELLVPEAQMLIRTEKVLWPSNNGWPRTLMEALFDVAGLPEKLVVRNFRSGDRFQPLGLTGRKKIKDLFIEKRVPLSLRARLPLLCADEEILWIPGYGRSERGRVGPETRQVARFTALFLESNATILC